MNAYKITVSGKVQKVGYRDRVEKIARELGIVGHVKNLENKDVEIVAQHANQEVLTQFMERVNIKDGAICVRAVHHESIQPQDYSDFEIVLGEMLGEIYESLVGGARILTGISNKQDETITVLAGISNKQDETISAIKGVGEKQDETILMIRDGNGKVVGEIKGMRDDFREHLKKDFAVMQIKIDNMEKEIAQIKQKVGA